MNVKGEEERKQRIGRRRREGKGKAGEVGRNEREVEKGLRREERGRRTSEEEAKRGSKGEKIWRV